MSEITSDSAPAAPQPLLFSTQGEFIHQLQHCFTRSQTCLQLIDPDFSQWGFDRLDTFQALRNFLLANHKIALVYRKGQYLERECKRFMPLLADFSQAIECRIMPRNLNHLTDSFCLTEQHLVRRFHCDHFRGESVFDAPTTNTVSSKRFADIWPMCDIGLQGSRTGL